MQPQISQITQIKISEISVICGLRPTSRILGVLPICQVHDNLPGFAVFIGADNADLGHHLYQPSRPAIPDIEPALD